MAWGVEAYRTYIQTEETVQQVASGQRWVGEEWEGGGRGEGSGGEGVPVTVH
jgi:hypothetical protein